MQPEKQSNQPNQTKVKICGLTNLADAQVALAAGADLLGFIFYAKSPRYVAPATAAAIVRELRAGAGPSASFACVGVFVNHAPAEVEEIVTAVGLDLIQLHGNEEIERLRSGPGRAFKALRPADRQSAHTQAAHFAPHGPATGPRWLLDAYDPHAYGGTGQRADWAVAAELARQYPGLLLAGGLRAENVAEAVRVVQPWGVDVGSGVEASPGQKDHGKVRAFVAARPGALDVVRVVLW